MRKRKGRRSKKKWPRYLASIGRAALDVFVAVKRKDPLYGGMAVLSTYEAVSAFVEETSSLEHLLAKEGFSRAFVGLEYFFWFTAKQLDCPTEMVKEIAGTDTNRALIEVELTDEVRVYGAFLNGSLTDVYVRDEDKATGAFVQRLSRLLGNCWYMSLHQIGWETFPIVQPLELSSTCFFPCYEEAELVERLRCFRERGLTNRSTLLCGPPGVGKTTMSWRVARALDGSLLVVDAACLDFICRSGINQKPLELMLKALKPTVLLLDDIDRMEEGSIKRLLGFVSRLQERAELLTFGTVNSLKELPHALCRPERFDEIVEMQPPTTEERGLILKAYCEEYGTRVCNGYIDELVQMTEGLTGIYLKEIAKQASIIEWPRLRQRVEHIACMAHRLLRKEGKEAQEKSPCNAETAPG